MAEISNWFISNYQELIGTILALLSLYFQTIQNKWLWPFGIVSSAIFAYIFLNAGIYADMALQIYFVAISIYGWYYWQKKQENNNEALPLRSILKGNYLILWLLIATIAIFLFLTQILIYFTDSTIPYIDAFVTALSITATWMLAKKYIEHWLIWIVVDTTSIAAFLYKQLYVTIILYIIYSIFAVIGYFLWLKSYRKEKLNVSKNNSMAY